MSEEVKVLGTGTWGSMNQPVETQPEVVQEQAEQVEQVQEPAAQEPVAQEASQVQAQAEPPVKPEINWDEIPFEEVLRKKGFDDTDIELLKYRKENGDLYPYLEAKSKDYNKMSDEEIMRHDLRSQYKNLSDEEFDLLYQSKVVDRFKLDRDVFDAEDRAAKTGLIELKLEAEQARQRMIEAQQKFAIPAKDLNAEAQRQQEEMQRQMEEFQRYVQNHPETKRLLSDKRLVIGQGDQSFNYAVTPEKIMEQIQAPEKFWSKFQNGSELDLAKAYRTMAYSENPDAYDKALIEYGKTLATKEIVEGDLMNIKPAAEVTPAREEETLGQAFARRGIHKTYGG